MYGLITDNNDLLYKWDFYLLPNKLEPGGSGKKRRGVNYVLLLFTKPTVIDVQAPKPTIVSLAFVPIKAVYLDRAVLLGQLHLLLQRQQVPDLDGAVPEAAND